MGESRTQRDAVEVAAAIYEAAVFPDRWPETLVALRCFVGGEMSMFALHYPASGQGEVLAAERLNPQTLSEWERRHGMGPWTRPAMGLPVGAVRAGHSMVPFSALQESRMYREILEPLGINDMLGVLTAKEPFVLGSVTFYDRDLFDESAVERLTALAPHLVRATSLRNRVAWLSARAAAFEDGVERLPIGVVLVGASGEMLHANARARRILDAGDGLIVDGGRLRAVEPEVRKLLEQTIRGVQMHDGTDGSVTVPRSSCDRPLQVRVSPSVDRHDRTREASALVWIHDPGDPAIPTPTALERIFGLTRVEARMAASVAAGQTVQEHAMAAGITEGTARQRLKQVLAKTGTRRQADLVRVILSSVPNLL